MLVGVALGRRAHLAQHSERGVIFAQGDVIEVLVVTNHTTCLVRVPNCSNPNFGAKGASFGCNEDYVGFGPPVGSALFPGRGSFIAS